MTYSYTEKKMFHKGYDKKVMIKKVFKDRLATILFLLSAAALIIAGILSDQHLDVLKKAVKICLECVGIG